MKTTKLSRIILGIVLVLSMLAGTVSCDNRDLCTDCHNTPSIVISGFPTLEPEKE